VSLVKAILIEADDDCCDARLLFRRKCYVWNEAVRGGVKWEACVRGGLNEVESEKS